MPWYEPIYGTNLNYAIHFKDLDKPQEKKTNTNQETKVEPPKKKLRSDEAPPSVKSPKKKTVKKIIKNKGPSKPKSKVTPNNFV